MHEKTCVIPIICIANTISNILFLNEIVHLLIKNFILIFEPAYDLHPARTYVSLGIYVERIYKI